MRHIRIIFAVLIATLISSTPAFAQDVQPASPFGTDGFLDTALNSEAVILPLCTPASACTDTSGDPITGDFIQLTDASGNGYVLPTPETFQLLNVLATNGESVSFDQSQANTYLGYQLDGTEVYGSVTYDNLLSEAAWGLLLTGQDLGLLDSAEDVNPALLALLGITVNEPTGSDGFLINPTENMSPAEQLARYMQLIELGLLGDMNQLSGQMSMYGTVPIWFVNPSMCTTVPGLCPPVVTEPVQPPPPATCPTPTAVQSTPALSIHPVAPAYPLVIGQDPEKRGADIQAQATIPPVTLTWYEPVYEQIDICRPVQTGEVGTCTLSSASWYQDGVLDSYEILKECRPHVAYLPERITSVQAGAALSAESRAWITGDLASKWYEAYVHQGTFNLAQYGAVSNGCNGATCSASLNALKVPFADPGKFNLQITVATNGAFWNGQQVTAPRFLNGNGEVSIYVILPTLIEAYTYP